LAVRVRRVFIGWPAWRPGIKPRPGHLRKVIVDLCCSDKEWAAHYSKFDKKYRKHYQQNRNFIQSISAGAIALIPRPKRGVVYAGRVKRPFELFDEPPWGQDYLTLRYDQGLPVEEKVYQLGDVAQCCEVEEFIEIPFPVIPAWIRRSFFGRSTYGRIWPLEKLGYDPYPILNRLLETPVRPPIRWTNNLEVAEQRLLNGVGPSSFEHLCVDILQLENPTQIWMHVGGSGDGGVDGEGATTSGKVVGLLQCKWAYNGEDIELSGPTSQGKVRQIVAALIHGGDIPERDGDEFWSRSHVASLVIKHSDALPLAKALRIRQ
jgi:hypothetical protein